MNLEVSQKQLLNLDANLCSLHCKEDSDMFKQHFGSLSNTHKIKSKYTLVRRFSSRYVVQWERDYPGDCKKLFSSPIRNGTNKSKSSENKDATHIVSKDISLQVIETEEARKSLEQDLKHSTQLREDGDQKEGMEKGRNHSCMQGSIW